MNNNLKEYKVTWRIEVDAATPEGAALAAEAYQRSEYKGIFEVEHDGEPALLVDLEDNSIHQRPQKFTVMLLRPDYATDNYGPDTYTKTVEAESPEAAVDLVKEACCAADELLSDEDEEGIEYRDDPPVLAVLRDAVDTEYKNDLHVLAVMRGAVEFA